MITARIAAFRALDSYFQHGTFVADALSSYKNSLSIRDFSFAYEVASGVVRQKKALDAIAGTLPKKRKEKVLLRMSLYQLLFLDKVPLFAICDEMVGLAKKECSEPFAKFLNAYLRNQAPKCTAKELVPSYTDFFIKRMVESYGQEAADEIFRLGNTHGPLFARDRMAMTMVAIDNVQPYANDIRYYIQNPTQFLIYNELKNVLKKAPEKILDLCASPGGKTILVHDFYPEATLSANDVTDKKIALLQQNLDKYAIKAHFSVGFRSEDKFDLIIVDAPCSNSGCLYKCPEARWRLTEDEVQKHVTLQITLLKQALESLLPNGIIWYSTCSILPEENEGVVAAFSQLKVLAQKRILPSSDGCEGGFGCALTRL